MVLIGVLSPNLRQDKGNRQTDGQNGIALGVADNTDKVLIALPSVNVVEIAVRTTFLHVYVAVADSSDHRTRDVLTTDSGGVETEKDIFRL